MYWVLENHRTFVFKPQTLDIRASDYALETPENDDDVRVNSRVQNSVSIYLRFVCTSPMSSWLPILYSTCYMIVVTPLYRKYPIVYSSLVDWLLPFHCWIGSGFINAPVIWFTLLSLPYCTYTTIFLWLQDISFFKFSYYRQYLLIFVTSLTKLVTNWTRPILGMLGQYQNTSRLIRVWIIL